jgi:outer membrane protein OmpA-like peptidoglycan-associated protein
MRPKYLETDSSGRDRWTVSYVDVLTILLIFFIAAAAKLPAVAKPPVEPQPVVKIETPPPKAPLAEAQEALIKAGLDARLENRGLVVSLPQAILFAPGDDRIAGDARPVLQALVDVIATLPNRVILCGHADATPIHNRRFGSNWELSAARGLRLLELLTTQFGMDESRFSVSSDGANRPVGPNDTPGGRASNRRVEIVIVQESAPSPSASGSVWNLPGQFRG